MYLGTTKKRKSSILLSTAIKTLLTAGLPLITGLGIETAHAEHLTLYVDKVTNQVYTTPGANRVKLGDFEQIIEEKAKRVMRPKTSEDLIPAEGHTADVYERIEHLEEKEAEIESKLQDVSVEAKAAQEQNNIAEQLGKIVKDKWYERISARGYLQFRYNEFLSGEDLAKTHFLGDSGIGQNQNFLIRRARLILSGDITDHLYLYLQPDFASTPAGTSTTYFAQLRDFYFDYAFDSDKEFRLRVGQSKIPFGWENMQSSQNRLALDRNDAINSCCKDERDTGVFFYWAPKEIRERFKHLVKSGLKGSGDYGVFAAGAYNGQGGGRPELNDYLHFVTRLTYPFELANGQFFEVGAQAMTGRFNVSSISSIKVNGVSITPEATSNRLQDERVAVSAIWYPQPFGLQAEWMWGTSPMLSEDFRTIDAGGIDGGYVQAMYKFDNLQLADMDIGTLIPFVRWQYYDGAYKFESNAPRAQVDEWEFGLEWQPRPEVELVMMYTNTDRTAFKSAPYDQFQADLLRMQLQFNY